MTNSSRIALFRSSSLFAAWSVSQGITEVLRSMGHEVIDCPIDPTKLQVSRSQFPSAEQLSACDGILISGPEHLGNHIRALYPEWNTLKVHKAGWMHETVEHPTYRIVPDDLKKLCETVFCPGIQDEKHGFKYLPFGVDTNVFKPAATEKKYEAAFIGSLYPLRQQFLEKLKPHLQGINLRVGMVGVQDLSGDCQRATAELLAENLRQIKVFVNLPSMSSHCVTKIFEVAACRSALITPVLNAPNGHMMHRNWSAFDDLAFELYDSPADCAGYLRRMLDEPDYPEQLADRACEEIHEHHRLDQRLSEILKSL